MQYSVLRGLVRQYTDDDGLARVDMPADLFRQILIGALRGKAIFDEAYYSEANPDVASAVEAGTLRSAADHYYLTGYFEGRLPKLIVVDEGYYLRHNRDVAEAIRNNQPLTAQSHFETAGFAEGRSPHDGFTLF